MSDARILFHLGLGTVGFLALLSPLWVSLLLVVFKGRHVRGRWLFLVVGPVVAYTILWVFTLLFIVPATFVLVLLAPATREIFRQMPYWFHVAAWVTEYQYLLAALTCGGLATWLAFGSGRAGQTSSSRSLSHPTVRVQTQTPERSAVRPNNSFNPRPATASLARPAGATASTIVAARPYKACLRGRG